MTDAAFLAEVEDFLTSCDLPSFPAMQAIKKARETTPTTPARRGRKKQNIDPETKRELQKANDRKRRSAYRERRRAEKETLEQQIGELSQQLSELEQQQDIDKMATTAWEVIAQKQMEARLSAEAKQRRLLTAIDARAAMIHEFKGFMHDRLSSKLELDEDLGDDSYCHKRMRMEPSDQEIFEVYVRDLDALYAKTDQMLQDCGLDDTKEYKEEHRQKWTEDGKTGFFEFVDKRVIPFSFEKTCLHNWKVAHLPHRQEDRQVFQLDDPENTAAIKFRITTRLKSGRAVSVIQRSVSRRYREKNRHVVVWRSFTEGEGIFSGMHADETGCCVCTPLQDPAEVGTVLRTFMRHVPMHFGRAGLQQPAIQEFTCVVLDSGTEDSTQIKDRLERLLLEDTEN